MEQLFLGVSAAGQALEVHCTGLDGEAAALQDCYDEEHALRMRLQVCTHAPEGACKAFSALLLLSLCPWIVLRYISS